jgi:hypothetical protein
MGERSLSFAPLDAIETAGLKKPRADCVAPRKSYKPAPLSRNTPTR